MLYPGPALTHPTWERPVLPSVPRYLSALDAHRISANCRPSHAVNTKIPITRPRSFSASCVGRANPSQDILRSISPCGPSNSRLTTHILEIRHVCLHTYFDLVNLSTDNRNPSCMIALCSGELVPSSDGPLNGWVMGPSSREICHRAGIRLDGSSYRGLMPLVAAKASGWILGYLI
jgi:hypothetical protein